MKFNKHIEWILKITYSVTILLNYTRIHGIINVGGGDSNGDGDSMIFSFPSIE